MTTVTNNDDIKMVIIKMVMAKKLEIMIGRFPAALYYRYKPCCSRNNLTSTAEV